MFYLSKPKALNGVRTQATPCFILKVIAFLEAPLVISKSGLLKVARIVLVSRIGKTVSS